VTVDSTRALEPTPAQTIGPFFAFGLEYPRMEQAVHPCSPGAVLLRGTVLDGAGAPVPDAMVEVFGTDEAGEVPRARGARRRDDVAFTGFARAFTDDEGVFRLWTLRPGRVGASAPFLATAVFARGLPAMLRTRIYLPADDAVLDADPLLSTLDGPERRTLVATVADDGHLQHEIRLQGEGETVFLAF
jgi:protocatechuate 3,4-dioxygenase alpha subunit